MNWGTTWGWVMIVWAATAQGVIASWAPVPSVETHVMISEWKSDLYVCECVCEFGGVGE